jgi:hypothetical protein
MSVCHYCGALDAAAKCSKCHSVLYCNRDCQTKDWKKVHKKECPDLAFDYAAAKEVSIKWCDFFFIIIHVSSSTHTHILR